MNQNGIVNINLLKIPDSFNPFLFLFKIPAINYQIHFTREKMDIKLLQYLSINSALPPVTEIAKKEATPYPPPVLTKKL